MNDKNTTDVTFKLPMKVKRRSTSDAVIIRYEAGSDQPWVDTEGCRYCADGRYSRHRNETSLDIIDILPDMRQEHRITITPIVISPRIAPAHRFLIGWALVAHIGLLCAASLIIHVLTSARAVYWWHDTIWPTAWIEKAVEK